MLRESNGEVSGRLRSLQSCVSSSVGGEFADELTREFDLSKGQQRHLQLSEHRQGSSPSGKPSGGGHGLEVHAQGVFEMSLSGLYNRAVRPPSGCSPRLTTLFIGDSSFMLRPSHTSRHASGRLLRLLP
jgi:hypothetical protein